MESTPCFFFVLLCRTATYSSCHDPWVVERSFGWLSRYRRLNIIFERSKEHLIAFVAIAFISIFSRRMRRLVKAGISA